MMRRASATIGGFGLTWVAAVFILCCATMARGDGFSGKVSGVPTGDAIMVFHDGKVDRVLLYGIACPRKGSLAKKARTLAEDTLFGNTVDVEVVADVSRRKIFGIVTFRELTLNEGLVKLGLAWVNPTWCQAKACAKWKNLQEEAKAAKRGVWGDPAAVPPWESSKQKGKGRTR